MDNDDDYGQEDQQVVDVDEDDDDGDEVVDQVAETIPVNATGGVGTF